MRILPFFRGNESVRRGVTEIGRATVIRLDLNDQVKGDGKIVRTRLLWVSVGWHPPAGDRQQQ
jgi:hypothetical protein